MRCPKNDGKKCFFWRFSGIFCRKDKDTDRYIISCSEERYLKKQGKEDGEKDLLRSEQENEQSYYYTDFIKNLIKEFDVIVNNKYDREYIQILTGLIKEITKFRQETDKAIKTAVNNVDNKNAHIKDAEKHEDTALVNVLNRQILEIKHECYRKITEQNESVRTKVSEVRSTLEQYNAYFNTELRLCMQKIGIYWELFSTVGLKIHGEKYENIRLPDSNMLLNISDVKNPAKSFEVREYDDIPKPENWENRIN